MSLSNAQKTLLRSENQWSVMGLAFLQPKTVLACQITDYTGTDQVTEFGFGNVTEGSYADVLPGQIIFFGSSAGAYDVGIGRVRKAWTSDTAYIGEVSDISFADGDFVTVVDAFDVRPRHLVVTSTATLMDVDVAYSDQHENFDPVVRMGGQVVVDVDTYPVVVSFPTVADSEVFDSTISSYLCEASEGVVSNGTTNNPSVTISSYPTNGYVRVSETITGANGKSFTGYRYIFVFDADNRPITDFVLDSCGADLESGGWSASVTLNDSADIALVRTGGLAVLFTKDYFDGSEDSVGLYAGRENVVMSGWVWQYTSMNDFEFQPRKFEIQSAAFWMSRMSSFPTGVEIKASAADAWTNMQNLTVDKGLFHFLHWRTTATQVMDVYFTGDTKYSPAVESSAVTIWDQIYDILQSQILGVPACNYNGLLALMIPYNLIPSADRAAASTLVMDLTTQDYERQVEILRQTNQIAQVVLNGVAVDEYGNGEALFSLSPGHVPALIGDLLPVPNLLLEDQTQSNILTGLVFAHENNPYPSIPLVMNGMNRAFDIAPVLYGTVAGLDEYTGTIIPHTIDLSYEQNEAGNAGKISVEVDFEGETTESDAIYINGDIPDGEGGFVDIGSLGKLPPLDPLDLPDIPTTDFPTGVPTTTTDCGSQQKNFFPLVWSKPTLIGNDSTKLVSHASFSCKLRNDSIMQSYIDFSVFIYGDAASHITVYGTLGGSRVVTGRLASGIGLYTFRAYFDVLSPTEVDGFDIELDYGPWEGAESISIYSQFACVATQVNDFTVKVQETGAGNYAVGITAAGAVTLHYWLPAGFIGRIARNNTTNPANLNWLATKGGAFYQGLTDGLWFDAGARDPFNDWHQYPTPSQWLEVGSVPWSGSQDTKLVNGFGTSGGSIIEIDYNTDFYIIAGDLAATRQIDIYGAVLNNVCAPS